MTERRGMSSYIRSPPTLTPISTTRSNPDVTPLSKQINFGDLYSPIPHKSKSSSGIRRSDSAGIKPVRKLHATGIDRSASNTENILSTHLGNLPRRPKQLPKLERPESPASARNIGFTPEITKKYV